MMERDKSKLSRDELVILLSACEKQAEEYYAPIVKKLELFETIVQLTETRILYCCEPGCDAACFRVKTDGKRVFRLHKCMSLESCTKYIHPDTNGHDKQAHWCDKHSHKGLHRFGHECSFILSNVCNQCAQSGVEFICGCKFDAGQ